MFEKDKSKENYVREAYSFEESIFNCYIQMRKVMNDYENMKYSVIDTKVESEDFKQGFLAGVKIISSMIIDI